MYEIISGDLRLRIMKGDITEQKTESIVNAANKQLAPGGGVAGAIHRVAGNELWEECRKLGGCQTGEAVITKGYNLPAKWVIHTVGPVYTGSDEDAEMLERSYANSIKLAEENSIESISFPAISTGAFGYPVRKAAEIAVKTAYRESMKTKSLKLIQFVLFDDRVYDIFMEVLKEVENE